MSRTVGACHVNINLNEHSLCNMRLMVLEQLCCDIILGLDILKEHERLVLSFSGHKAPIELTSPFSPSISCSLAKSDIEPPSLFANLEGNLRPIACGSRKFSNQELCFIKQTIDSLLESDIIRPSNSPWRAQVLVTGLNKPNAKPRMVVDYSRTINKSTLLDTYPLPNMERKVTADCGDCARIKPKFIRPLNPPLIEATKPLDRISIDFKGPLPSSTKNKYMLVIIDEYSRFPFVYACPNMESSTIIRCLSNLFSMFGTVGYVHSNNGPSLTSSELRKFFLDHGIGFSNSSKYNPRVGAVLLRARAQCTAHRLALSTGHGCRLYDPQI